MIDEIGTVLASFVLKKYSLPVVRMACTDIDQPRQPEILAVRNPPETVARKYLKYAFVVPAQEARPKAQSARRPERPFRRLQPAAWIPVKELDGNQQRLPIGHTQMECSIELGSDGTVERQVLTLEVVCEFGNIKVPVTRPH
ncbi:MAG: hypothetical protein ACLPY1_15355 [Terracidiphilus sp.]